MSKADPIPPVLTTQDIKRFWSHVNQSPGQGPKGECWEWKRARDKDGYGKFAAGASRFVFRHYRAHRIAYFIDHPEAYNGDLLTCHSCDNPPCVRPDHLFQGTQKANREDAMRKGRTASGDRQSMRLHPELIRRGEARSTAKLNNAKVREMRALYDTGQVTNFTLLGSMFGVSNVLATRIVRRQNWTHI